MHKEGNKFFLVMGSVAVLGIVLFLLVFLLLTPYKNIILEETSSGGEVSLLNLLFFYGSLIVLFTGFFSTFFFWVKVKKGFKNNLYLQAVTAFRRGILMGILICLLLIMQSLRIFIWWDALLLVGMIVLLEMYLIVK